MGTIQAKEIPVMACAPQEAKDGHGQKLNGHISVDEAASEEALQQEYPVKKLIARRVVLAVVFLAVCIGVVCGIGFGTISSFGWESIAAICPLGALESMLAAKLFIPQALVFLLIVALLALVFGKFFCSWICPVPSVRSFINVITRKTSRVKVEKMQSEDGRETLSVHAEQVSPCHKAQKKANCACNALHEHATFDSRHVILGSALISTALFSFPVFCLICPIGLIFASIIAIAQLFGLQTLSWGILVFPLLLVLELTVLRKWCTRFCPLGAFISLLSLPNRLFRPKVDETKCLQSKGVDCTVCSDLCPEDVDPHFAAGMHDCSKCHDCAVNCPMHAIDFPVRPRRAN